MVIKISKSKTELHFPLILASRKLKLKVKISKFYLFSHSCFLNKLWSSLCLIITVCFVFLIQKVRKSRKIIVNFPDILVVNCIFENEELNFIDWRSKNIVTKLLGIRKSLSTQISLILNRFSFKVVLSPTNKVSFFPLKDPINEYNNWDICWIFYDPEDKFILKCSIGIFLIFYYNFFCY